MKAHYDPQAKALYITIGSADSPAITYTHSGITPNMQIDIDEHGDVFGYEFLLDDELIELAPQKTKKIKKIGG